VKPKAGRSQENKAIMSTQARKSNVGQMKPVSGAVRDVQVAEMTFDDIRNFLCPAASDKDTFMFLKLCQARNLNPFCNEAYLIPYEDKKSGEIKCSIVVGKEAFMRKAESNPAYRGFKAGIIISKGEELIYREGTLCRKGETLEGGWCEVYRSDRDQPIRSEVSLIEYDKGFGLWNQGKKATMIRKTAVVSGHREAFPGDTSGMYGSEELGIDPEMEVKT
jgi:phage recombination protein Bet